MIEYTKEEFDSLISSAKNEFKKFYEECLKKYNIFLTSLDIEKYDSFYKVDKALEERDRYSSVLYNFIQTTYPKTDDIVSNVGVIYTIETKINISLLSKDYKLADTQFQKLYQDFFERNFPEDIVP